ncbi:uncharacterized protein NEMAJ01_2312, partial [Nematocida major]|uniref:uncharacterized protein n=1 Tax=Nematocida major TaxID=1912982 RepID=UPI0020074EBB
MSIHILLFALVSACVGFAAIVAVRRLFGIRPEAGKQQPETQTYPVIPSEGMMHSFLQGVGGLNCPFHCKEDLLVANGSAMYYLIEGAVEVILNGAVIMCKTQDYFAYSAYWLFNPSHRTEITYRIRQESFLYKISPEDPTVRYLLLNRLFKGVMHTIVNYVEEDLSGDVRTVKGSVESPSRDVLGVIRQEMELLKSAKVSEEIEIEGAEYEIPPCTLVYIVEGSASVEYSGGRSLGVQGKSLVGCLERFLPLESRRVIRPKSKVLAVLIKLFPTVETDCTSLEKVGAEVLQEFPSRLHVELADALIGWRILQPGEKMSADLPTKSIKLITNGYFLRTGDVKYFGVSSKNALFEKEVLLEQESPFELVSTRLSEIVEIPKEYVGTVCEQFQPLSFRLYKRILGRTGEDLELEQPSIITFVPNSPKETQLDVFTHFLRKEMQKTDSCYILSSAEIEKTFTFKAPHESRICEILLLNYLREIQ